MANFWQPCHLIARRSIAATIAWGLQPCISHHLQDIGLSLRSWPRGTWPFPSGSLAAQSLDWLFAGNLRRGEAGAQLERGQNPNHSWVTNSGAIRVLYDANGKVVHKVFFDVHVSGFLRWVRNLVRIDPINNDRKVEAGRPGR